MSIGDGRDGKVRAGMVKGHLGGKLEGKSLPRQIVSIAFWPLMENTLSFICSITSLFLATHLGTPEEMTKQIAAGMGVVSQMMLLGFLMQGAVGMGATAIVSRMTGARRFGRANYTTNQAAMLGFLAGLLSALLMLATADFFIRDVVLLSSYAAEVALQYMHIACWVAVLSGIVFAVNAAMRGAGDTRTPFIIMLLVDGLNIVFSLIFVYVFHLGIAGLAYGLIGGMGVAVAVLLGILLRRSMRMRRELRAAGAESAASGSIATEGSGSGISAELDAFCAARGLGYVPPLFLDRRSLRPDFGEMWRIISIGFPQALEVGGIWCIQVYVLRVISGLGDAAVGAHNIAVRIESMSFLPGFAIGLAGATLVGQYLGTGSARMALETVKRCARYAVAFMGAMGLLFFFFPEFFVSILASNSRDLVETATPVIRFFLIAEPIFAAMMVIKMSLRGAGDTRRVMFVSFGCLGFFRFVVLVLWHHFWPESITLLGIWMLFTLDMLAEFVILRRMLNGLKWARRKV